MFTCKDLIDSLVDYLDGALDEPTQQALVEHLAACEGCVEFLKSYKATTDVCRKVLVDKMPQGLCDRLTAVVRAKCNSKK